MSAHDRQFYQTFAVVIGILFALKLGLIGLAVAISSGTGVGDNERFPYSEQVVEDRIRADVEVAVREQSPAGGAGGGTQTASVSAEDLGRQTFEQACFACHGTGVAGAPRIGDTANWAPRIAQGRDTLIQHSLEGYQGNSGFMPPKGGQVQLPDEAVIAALDYMVSQSR